MPKATLPLDFRFLRLVDKTDTCWLWVGAVLPNGYPRFNHGSGYAHRVAYEMWVGPIPAGMTIDHMCNVKRCVNPAHLRVASNRENILRSNGPAALNARKTHCKHGHEFTTQNTIAGTRRGNPTRECRICKQDRARQRYA